MVEWTATCTRCVKCKAGARSSVDRVLVSEAKGHRFDSLSGAPSNHRNAQPRSKNAVQSTQGHRYGRSNRIGFIGRRLRPVSLPEPVVFHTDRLQLGRDRRDRDDHVLGHRVCLRRHQFVHGLLRVCATVTGRGKLGALRTRRTRKLEWALILATTVGVVAMLAPGLFAWAKFIEVPKDAAAFRGRGPAVVL